MDSNSKSDTSRLAEVLRRLESLEQRVGSLEHGTDTESYVPAVPEVDEAMGLQMPAVAFSEWLPMVGRTLLVMGGGFVLRAITEAELVPPYLGSALGIAYALVWLFLADRDGGRGRLASATWYGVATCVIAYPLLWEASTRFGFLGPGSTATAVLGVTVLAFAVVWRRKLRALAWVVTLAAVAVVMALAIDTRLLELFSGCLLFIGLATLWLAYTRRFTGPARLAALAAFASILLLTLIHFLADPGRRAEMFDPRIAIALQLSLIVVYIGSSIGRTLSRHRTLRAEEITYGLAATAIGLGGAFAVAISTGTGLLWLGLVSALLCAAGYWAAFALVDRTERRTNFVFFSSLALVFALVAFAVLLPPIWLSLALAAATVGMAAIGTQWGRPTVSLHGSVYAVVGALASGLWAFGFLAFGLPGFAERSGPTVAMLAVLAGAIAYCAFPVAGRERTWGRLTRLPKLIVLIVVVIGLGGIITTLAAQLLPRAADGVAAAPTALAVLRTAVLAVAAVVLAWLGRYKLVGQAVWLVYPVLVVGGLKLVAEDLRLGVPLALVASFAFYGGALILAPRLTRLRRPDDHG